MSAAPNPIPLRPRRWAVAARIALITGLVTVVAFALALFAGIAGLALANLFRDGAINMSHAYRSVALPVAAVALVVALVAASRYEIRQYRRQRDAWRQRP
jgi:ABC-type branched-subunit amino acid transport system permease subunit